MHAIRLERFGEPSELCVQEVPTPRPGPGEVLVEVHAASINPSDVKNVQGQMATTTTLPRVLGRDFAGVVVEGPKELLGVEVWGTGGDLGFTVDGSHAEYILLPIDAVRPKPRALTMEQAASVGVNYVTVWAALEDAAGLSPGGTLVVIGATGGVGSAALQFARWRGMRALGTVRREADIELARRYGAELVIQTDKESLPQAVRAATRGQGAEVVLDTVGGPLFEPALGCLCVRGRLVEISATGEQRVGFDLRDFYRRELRLFGINSLHLDAPACASILERLTPAFDSGALRPLPTRTFPLEEAAAAYELVRTRGGVEKPVLTPRRR